MHAPEQRRSPRHEELLEQAYQYALEHGLADLSLRPLATAIGSSPRVLLFLFGSKDGLIRALLARARTDELTVLDRARAETGHDDLASAQPAARRRSKTGIAERTLALSVLRGALLDLLATGDAERTTAAVEHHLRLSST